MLAIVHDHQQHTSHHKRSGENCGRAGQQIGRRTARHEARHPAAAHAERAALALLQQNDANEGDGDQDVQGKQQDNHRKMT